MNENTPPSPIVSNADTTTDNEDYKNKYLYILADFDNYKKNVHKRVSILEANNLKDIVNKFLVIIDDLERMSETISDKDSLEVINIIIKKFHDTLLTYGIKKYNSLGEQATHKLHNVISTEVSPNTESNTIIKVYQEGYMYNNDVLRFAIVGVAK